MEQTTHDDAIGASGTPPAMPHHSRRIEVHVDQIEVNPFQPRHIFDEEHIENLARSIAEIGLLDAPTARLHPEKADFYQLIDGQNRWDALCRMEARADHSGYFEIQVREANDQQMLEIALTQNIQRKMLNPLDEAWGFAELEKMGLTQLQIGAKYGYSQPGVANKIRLLRLPESVKDAIRANNLSAGHGMALLALPSEWQTKWAIAAMENDQSVKALEREIRRFNDEQKAQNEPPLPIQHDEKPPEKDAPVSDEELDFVKGKTKTLEPGVADDQAEIEEQTQTATEGEETDSEPEVEEVTPSTPVVSGAPTMAMIPASEAAWLKSKSLTAGVALAHFRRFYELCESIPVLTNLLDSGGLGDVMDGLERELAGGEK